MILAHTREQLRNALASQNSVGFVPTMGALHAGHRKLIESSVNENFCTVVSIFVNPTQFSPTEDLSKYPRPLESDLELCEASGVDIVFLPTPDVIYTKEEVWVEVASVSDEYEGASRPTHFRGVATVVAKLLLLTQPNRAYFGLKDLQQCAVVRNLVAGLFLPVELRFVETVREPSGLALSSRNAYFAPEDRQRAAQLFQSLISLGVELRADPDSRLAAISKYNSILSEAGFSVEYLDVIDPATMRATDQLISARIVVAAKFCGVRLIDNIPIYS